jgi:hypothetical protein
MDSLTIALVTAGIILLVAALLFGRRYFSRDARSTQIGLSGHRPRSSAKSERHLRSPRAAETQRRVSTETTIRTTAVHVQTKLEILESRLINSFGGNRGAMNRSIDFERKQNPNLTNVELLEKMLYDLERGR